MSVNHPTLLLEIADMLAEAGFGTVGVDIIVGELVVGTENAIMILEGVSPDPDQYVDTQYLVFSIVTRDSESGEGYNKLRSIFSFLHRNANYSRGDFYVYFTRATGNIENNGRDTEGRRMLQQNYESIYRDTLIVS